MRIRELAAALKEQAALISWPLRSGTLRLGVVSGLPALTIAILLGAASYFVFLSLPHRRAEMVERWRRQLETTADDGKAAIDLWLSNGLDDAEAAASSPPIGQSLSGQERAARPIPASLVDALLTSVVSAHGYRSGYVVDGSFRLVGRDAGPGALEASCLEAARGVLSSGVAAAAFHRHAGGGSVVTFAAPVRGEGAGTRQASPW